MITKLSGDTLDDGKRMYIILKTLKTQDFKIYKSLHGTLWFLYKNDQSRKGTGEIRWYFKS